jgi:hypothetical protein
MTVLTFCSKYAAIINSQTILVFNILLKILCAIIHQKMPGINNCDNLAVDNAFQHLY